MGGSVRSFFSISFDFFQVNVPQLFDLYVNSSSLTGREKFVRIHPVGEIISEEEVGNLKIKYSRLYVPEEQRRQYLESITKSEGRTVEEKSHLIKHMAITYLDRLFDEDKEFTTEILNETITGCRDVVASMVDVVSGYNIENLQQLIANLSFHDFYTYDHSINVSMYCIAIYKSLRPNASKMEITTAGLGGLLHDLGKIKIPTKIINNSGKLSEEDFRIIQTHPANGLELMNSVPADYEDVDLEVIKRIVYEHHENFDGSGYPGHLRGEEIHIMARITAIADFFDAITTKRSYHEILPIQKALELMATTKGKKLDPKLFEYFVKTVDRSKEKNNVVVCSPLNENGPLISINSDFDPCQPHDELPIKYEAKKLKRDEKFGKVTIK